MSDPALSEVVYPWYRSVNEDDIQQGDVFKNIYVFLPPAELSLDLEEETEFEYENRDVIVMSQTCDMIKGREKISEALLCAIWGLSELSEINLDKSKDKEDIRRGNRPSLHMLAPCEISGLEREACVVDFRRVHSLPLSYLRQKGANSGNRPRLLPPYREHLSQAFARFFMRVGLPVDIPAFK